MGVADVHTVAKLTNLQQLTLRLTLPQPNEISALSTTLQALQCPTCLELKGMPGAQSNLGQLTKVQVLSVGSGRR
jgi:hypothetical protein